MKPAIIRAVLSPDMPSSGATLKVALGIIETLSNEISADLNVAIKGLQQRRRAGHKEVLQTAKDQAESLVYVSKWICDRVAATCAHDDDDFVIAGADVEPIELRGCLPAES